MYNLRLEDATDIPDNPRAGELCTGGLLIVGPELTKYGITIGQQYVYESNDRLVWTVVGFAEDKVCVTCSEFLGVYTANWITVLDRIKRYART